MQTDDSTTTEQPARAVDRISYTEQAGAGWTSAGYTEGTQQGRVVLYQRHGSGRPMPTDPIYVEHIAQAGPLVLIVGLQTYTEPDPEWVGLLVPVLKGIVLATAELDQYPLVADLLAQPDPPAAPLALPIGTLDSVREVVA